MDGFCFLHSFNFPQSALMTYTRAVAEISLEHLIKFLTLQSDQFVLQYSSATQAHERSHKHTQYMPAQQQKK